MKYIFNETILRGIFLTLFEKMFKQYCRRYLFLKQ